MQNIPVIIIPIVLDGLFLVLGGLEHSPAVWIGFCFANLSYILFAIAGHVRKHSAAENRSAKLTAIINLFVQLFIFLLSLIFGMFSTGSAIFFHVIVDLVFVVLFLTNHNVSDRDTASRERIDFDRRHILMAQREIETLWRSTTEPALKKVLEQLNDDLQSCQFSEASPIREIDKVIQKEVLMIHDYVDDDNFEATVTSITRVKQLLQNREAEIRMNR